MVGDVLVGGGNTRVGYYTIPGSGCNIGRKKEQEYPIKVKSKVVLVVGLTGGLAYSFMRNWMPFSFILPN